MLFLADKNIKTVGTVVSMSVGLLISRPTDIDTPQDTQHKYTQPPPSCANNFIVLSAQQSLNNCANNFYIFIC
jgi:hypothetical protein